MTELTNVGGYPITVYPGSQGVQQIVGGGGVVISSSGPNGTGIVTISFVGQGGSTVSGITAVNGGTGITAVTSGGVVSLTNTGVTGLVAGTGVTLSASTGLVTISATGTAGVTTATAGTGISVSAATGAVTFTNTGVTSITAGSGITLSAATGAVTISSTGGTGGISSVSATGSGLTATTTSGAVTLQNTGVTSIVAGTGVTISGATGAVTINAPGGGSGISSVTATGAGITANTTSGAVTIANTGVTSATAGAGIGVSAASGAVTFSNTGVTSLTAGTNITLSGTTGAVTINASGGSGSGTVSSGTAGTLAYYAATGTTVSQLALGTNLSITGGTLNATGTGGGVTSLTAGNGITLSGSTGAVTVSLNGAIVTAQSLTFSGTTNTTAQAITLASGVAPSNGYFTYVVTNATYTAAQAQQLVPTTGTAGVAGDIFQWTGTAFIQLPQNVVTGAANQLGYYAAAGQILSPLTLGTNLSITGSTLNATGGGGGGVGAAQNLAAGGWDFGMLPSGTVSTAGVWTITGSSGLLTLYRGYAYFPAGAITAGAGLYWVVSTTTTVANVYQPLILASGFPVPPTTLTAVTGTNTAYTQTTASVNLFSLALYPTVTLGNYGHVRWDSYSNLLSGSNNNVYFDVSASNTGVGTYTLGFAGGSNFQFELFNQGTASQILASRISVVPEPTATTSINTSAACYLRIGMSMGAATNSFSVAGNSFTAFVGV